jgi:hypothetical protein
MQTDRRTWLRIRGGDSLTLLPAALACALGAIVLGEWILGPLRVAQVASRFHPMAPTTAACLVLLGAALIGRRVTFGRPRPRVVLSVHLTEE